jgi:hypothetical protein
MSELIDKFTILHGFIIEYYSVSTIIQMAVLVALISLIVIGAILIGPALKKWLVEKVSSPVGPDNPPPVGIDSYFIERPDDIYWSRVTNLNVLSINNEFSSLVEVVGLEGFNSSMALDKRAVSAIQDRLLKTYSKRDPEFYIVFTLALQYVDSPEEDRKKYTDIWVAIMVDRDPIAPPPESYIDFFAKNCK